MTRLKTTRPSSDKKQREAGSSSILRLTDEELTHVRDLFSVRLPSAAAGYPSVSQSLAAVENREALETELWSKIAALCVERGIAVEQSAPDHVVVLSAPPELAVMSCEMRQADDSCDVDVSPFAE